ncbi:MAG: carbohydrate ABC transporter permease [Oscillospiraceae bacterium]|nr:carbohydrate ABC transporter permease [Oscillospiraceae bacterium]
MRTAGSKTVFKFFCYFIAFLFLFIYIYPLFFAFNTSIRTREDYLRNPMGLTTTWAFENYSTAWGMAGFHNYIFNSVLYTVIATGLSLMLSMLVAFPLSRNYIPGSKFLYYMFLCGIFLPSGMIPLFQLILNLGLYNTRPGYILVMTGVNSTSVFFFYNYIKGLPRDLDEAASIDGCGYFRYVFTCVTPLILPALTSMGVLTMIGVWNDIITSTIYLVNPDLYNITRGLFVFQGNYAFDVTIRAAGLFIVAAPLVLVYIFAQRYIVDGIMAGGVKG